jgi:hypothetical protein
MESKQCKYESRPVRLTEYLRLCTVIFVFFTATLFDVFLTIRRLRQMETTV